MPILFWSMEPSSAGQLREIIMQELLALKSAKLIREDVDIGIEANVLLALVNGIALDFLIQEKRLDFDRQQMIIRQYIKGFE